MIFAIPLFINPTWTLGIFGITVELVTARLVAAALFGIGGTSFLTYHKTIESFKTMIDLKLIWSSFAILGLSWSLIEGTAKPVWLILGLFVFFNLVWVYYRIKLQK